ncbi:hypothetical protein ABZ896_13515 [Streptomyces sp. NPDC047072]
MTQTSQREALGNSDPLLPRHLDDARQLAAVLRLCIDKDVHLLFS